jgi:HD-like signal output (HDOD) protein
LTVHVFSQFSTIGDSFFCMDRLWAESFATGALARAIAKAEQAPSLAVEQSCTAGLLHDVGMLVFAANVIEQYNAMLKMAHDKNISVWEAERQEFGATRAEVGGYLLGLWGLSDPIVEAVAFHHHPMECAGEAFSPLTAVHVANALQQELSLQAVEGVASHLDTCYLEKLHMTDRLPQWRELARTLQKEDRDG